mgnify:CR=1 FL=1
MKLTNRLVLKKVKIVILILLILNKLVYHNKIINNNLNKIIVKLNLKI